jgi:hypothetical protein
VAVSKKKHISNAKRRKEKTGNWKATDSLRVPLALKSFWWLHNLEISVI